MSELLLIRHGQASFGTADYDALSDLGQRQAKLVGEYLVDNGYRFDGLYCGTLQRQRQTAQQVIGAYTDAGQPAAPLREIAGFNEMDNEAQIRFLAPQLAQRNGQVSQLLGSAHDSKKDFQKLVKIVFNEWQAGSCSDPRLQTWQVFKNNVLGALTRVQEEQGSGTTSAIFTSGGVIATVVAHVLQMPDTAVYSVFEPVINCSITRLLYGNQRVSLSTYNEYSYLKNRGAAANLANVITYR